jgi:hypothetical protein
VYSKVIQYTNLHDAPWHSGLNGRSYGNGRILFGG